MILFCYTSIDGAERREAFFSLDAARERAQYWMGKHPTLGTFYAVTDDGIGRLEITGGEATLQDLFPDSSTPTLEDLA